MNLTNFNFQLFFWSHVLSFIYRETKLDVVPIPEEETNNLTDLSAADRECIIQNFRFYEKNKGGGAVELFELPMVLNTCGYNLSPIRIQELQEFLFERKALKIETNCLLESLRYLKQLDLQNEQDRDLDEYVDAFVAMGGDADTSGTVSK